MLEHPSMLMRNPFGHISRKGEAREPSKPRSSEYGGRNYNGPKVAKFLVG